MIAATFDGVARFVWSRNRKLILACAAIYLALYISSQTLSSEMVQPYLMPVFAFLRVTPFFLPLILFVTSVSMVTQELIGPEGHFPSHFFTLPVKARAMVLPFMAYAVIVAALLWALGLVITDGDALMFGPPGTPPAGKVQVLWVPFLCASMLVWTQTIIWTPFPRRWIRLWVLLGAVLAHAIVVAQSVQDALSHNAVIVLSLVQLPLAYLAAAYGVSRDRVGEPDRFRKRANHDKRAAPARPRALRAFSSAFEAQVWFESSVHRWTGKAILIFAIPAVVLLLLIAASFHGGGERNPQALAALAKFVVILCAWLLMMLTLTTGLSFASFRGITKSTSADAAAMPAFFAALPLSTGDFAWAKIKSSVANMAWICAGVGMIGVGAAQLGHLFDLSGGWILTLRQQHGDFGAVLLLAGTLVAIVLLTLLGTANVMSMALPGRTSHWIGWTHAGVFAVVGIASAEIARHWGRYGTPPEVLPTVLRTLAIVKLCGLAYLIYYVGSRGLLSWTRLGKIAAAWIAAVAVTLAVAMGFLPHGAITLLTAVSMVILISPVLGIVATPLALHVNRCR